MSETEHRKLKKLADTQGLTVSEFLRRQAKIMDLEQMPNLLRKGS